MGVAQEHCEHILDNVDILRQSMGGMILVDLRSSYFIWKEHSSYRVNLSFEGGFYIHHEGALQLRQP
jgi:hypothetical protein